MADIIEIVDALPPPSAKEVSKLMTMLLADQHKRDMDTAEFATYYGLSEAQFILHLTTTTAMTRREYDGLTVQLFANRVLDQMDANDADRDFN